MQFATLGPGPALITLAGMNVATVALFVLSLLFPAFAVAGLWSAARSHGAWKFMRIYVATACTALLIASVFAASIGWVGIRTWAA